MSRARNRQNHRVKLESERWNQNDSEIDTEDISNEDDEAKESSDIPEPGGKKGKRAENQEVRTRKVRVNTPGQSVTNQDLLTHQLSYIGATSAGNGRMDRVFLGLRIFKVSQ